jgi:hypothetical protein
MIVFDVVIWLTVITAVCLAVSDHRETRELREELERDQ